MILKVIPQRIIRAADELRLTERRLTMAANSIEEVIGSLKYPGDESMLIITARLTKTLEELRKRIRITHLMMTALERIAAVYIRTEDNIRSYEEDNITMAASLKTTDIRGVRPMAERIFEKL